MGEYVVSGLLLLGALAICISAVRRKSKAMTVAGLLFVVLVMEQVYWSLTTTNH